MLARGRQKRQVQGHMQEGDRSLPLPKIGLTAMPPAMLQSSLPQARTQPALLAWKRSRRSCRRASSAGSTGKEASEGLVPLASTCSAAASEAACIGGSNHMGGSSLDAAWCPLVCSSWLRQHSAARPVAAGSPSPSPPWPAGSAQSWLQRSAERRRWWPPGAAAASQSQR